MVKLLRVAVLVMVLVELGRAGGDYVWDGEQWQWLTYDAHTYDDSVVRVRYGDDEDKLDGEEESSIPDPVEGNVTAILGKGALLNCRVRGIGNRTVLNNVSWIRHKDSHLLTVGRYRYISDERFRAITKVPSEDYLLQILPVKISDSGLYECQISTTPVQRHHVWLTVAEPVTEILGAPDIYIEEGVTMNLTCMVR